MTLFCSHIDGEVYKNFKKMMVSVTKQEQSKTNPIQHENTPRQMPKSMKNNPPLQMIKWLKYGNRLNIFWFVVVVY